MGNILDFALEQNPDKEMIEDMKNKFMIEQFIDKIDDFDSHNPHKYYLNFNEYSKILTPHYSSSILDKIYHLLLKEKEGVLKYDVFVLFILLSKGSFESKMNSVFNIFCINDDDTLISTDIVLMIKCSIHPIFRICKIKSPDDEEIKIMLERHFPGLFDDENFEINYEEFYEWLSANDEIQAFLMEFFEVQTRHNAMKVYLKYLSEFELIFEKLKKNPEMNKNTKKKFFKQKTIESKITSEALLDSTENSLCTVIDILDEVGEILEKIDPKSKEIFKELVDPDLTGWVRKDRYMRSIKAICLFMAVDKDMSHTLSKSEIGTLIWLLSGEEPNDSNLNTTLKYLDSNGDSAIEMNEWIDYLATTDSKGRKVINYTLKQKFDLYDEDGSGTISINELQKLIYDSFEDLINKVENIDQKNVAKSIVKDLGVNIMSKIDVNNSDSLDWTEFKSYLKIAMSEENKIADYLEKFLLGN